MSEPALPEVARYRVIFGDCDPMRIVYYGNYFRMFEIGRAEWFRQLGHPFKTYIDQGLYLGVIEARCRYRRPARYDDDLAIHAGIINLGRARLEIGYEIRGPSTDLLVTGSTSHAIMDDDGRPRRLPDDFRKIVQAVLPAEAAD